MYILYVYLLLQLFILVNCPPGSHGVTGSTCAQCTIDTFQDQQGQATCRSCPSDQGTLSTGAVECTGDNNIAMAQTPTTLIASYSANRHYN